MKEAEKGVIGESIRGEGGGDDFLRYFNGTVFALIVRSWKFRARWILYGIWIWTGCVCDLLTRVLGLNCNQQLIVLEHVTHN